MTKAWTRRHEIIKKWDKKKVIAKGNFFCVDFCDEGGTHNTNVFVYYENATDMRQQRQMC